MRVPQQSLNSEEGEGRYRDKCCELSPTRKGLLSENISPSFVCDFKLDIAGCVGRLMETHPRHLLTHSTSLTAVMDAAEGVRDLPRHVLQQIRKLESSLMKQLVSQVLDLEAFRGIF